MQRKSSIHRLIVAHDYAAIGQQVLDRFGVEIDYTELATICQLVTSPETIDFGRSGDTSWDDSTWLIWIKNRIDEIGSRSFDELKERYRKPTSFPTLCTPQQWREFLDEYSALAASVATNEEWHDSPFLRDDLKYEAAGELSIANTEHRLGVKLPPSLRSFYEVTNGWPGDEWYHPPINPINEVTWLKESDAGLFSVVQKTLLDGRPWRNDPDGKRREEYQFQAGTRVLRSLALNQDTNDFGTLLIDPYTEGSEWACKLWAHWHVEVDWECEDFSRYMRSRFEFLANLKRDAE